jgi:prepilin-type N-terminal cleavage/methylation domain-containing protein
MTGTKFTASEIRAFTLIELLVTIAIIVILAALAAAGSGR